MMMMVWFILCYSPVFTHLAGSSSVWKALSPAILQASFNVQPKMEQLFRSKRKSDAIFFPPPKHAKMVLFLFVLERLEKKTGSNHIVRFFLNVFSPFVSVKKTISPFVIWTMFLIFHFNKIISGFKYIFSIILLLISCINFFSSRSLYNSKLLNSLFH